MEFMSLTNSGKSIWPSPSMSTASMISLSWKQKVVRMGAEIDQGRAMSSQMKKGNSIEDVITNEKGNSIEDLSKPNATTNLAFAEVHAHLAHDLAELVTSDLAAAVDVKVAEGGTKLILKNRKQESEGPKKTEKGKAT